MAADAVTFVVSMPSAASVLGKTLLEIASHERIARHCLETLGTRKS